MQIVLLKMSADKEKAVPLMAAHKVWLQQGFDDGVFLASGNLQGQPGGGILVHGVSTETLEQRLQQDPFVKHGIVTVEIIDLAITRSSPDLAFLQETPA